MNEETLRNICRTVRRLRTDFDTDYLCTEDEYETFKDKYPKLYRYILDEPDETYDVEMLESMLIQRQKIDNNSEESFVETNMRVAETIADRYLYNDDTLKKTERKRNEETS